MVAVAECFRGDGEILANPIGTIPMIGGRLARATFEPDLAMTDGEATLVANDEAFPSPDARVVEHFNPYRHMFDFVWSGRRHVMMGASQVDQYGNQNIAAIGHPGRPKVQLLGYRGAPGNTINDVTSYWVPNHSPAWCASRSTPSVASATTGRASLVTAARFHEIRRVVTNLCVLDFETPDQAHAPPLGAPRSDGRRCRGGHGLRAGRPRRRAVESRQPDDEELRLIREVIDPESRTGHRGSSIRA